MKPEYIILHHSLTADSKTVSWEAIRNYHVNVLGWDDIGYHYGIELIGGRYQILIGRMADEPGAHCRQSGMNYKSLGICMIGNFDKAPPPLQQLRLAVRLIRSLMRVHGIAVERVMPHNLLAHYKSCPGYLFPWGVFETAISKKR